MIDLFFACLLVGFGGAAVFLFAVVLPHSHLAVIAILGAFFQLLALLLTSLFHLIPVNEANAQGYVAVCVGVLLQEVCRFLFFRLYASTERVLLKQSGLVALPWTPFAAAVCGGFGFGLMNSLMLFGGVVGQSAGRADFFTCPGSTLSGFVLLAFVALGMQLGHVSWMLVVFSPRPWGAGKWALAFVLHLLASLATLLNSRETCNLGLPLQYLVVLVSIALGIRLH